MFGFSTGHSYVLGVLASHWKGENLDVEAKIESEKGQRSSQESNQGYLACLECIFWGVLLMLIIALRTV